MSDRVLDAALPLLRRVYGSKATVRLYAHLVDIRDRNTGSLSREDEDARAVTAAKAA